MHDQIKIEDFKRGCERLATHENRYHQMLILSVAGIATILGLSDKVPKELIPYMISPFIFITVSIAVSNKIDQNFASAFLLQFYYKKFPAIYYEKASVDRSSMQKKRRGFLLYIIRPIRLVRHPLIIIAILSFIASFYFGSDYIQELFNKGLYLILLMYASPLLLLYLLIIRDIYRLKANNKNYFTRYCEKISKSYRKDKI